MKCKVDNCDRESAYKAKQLCQMHYFRMMRNGSYDKKITRQYRLENPAGYYAVYEPDCILSDARGYVYEHRFIYFGEVDADPQKCELCGSSVDWSFCHIDHKDNDIKNNNTDNLRCLCMSCNVFRGHNETSMGKLFLTINGRTLSCYTWARMPDVKVSHATIRRRKKVGMNDYDSVYGARKTHQTTCTKKYNAKYDEVRGIL